MTRLPPRIVYFRDKPAELHVPIEAVEGFGTVAEIKITLSHQTLLNLNADIAKALSFSDI